MKTEEKAPEDDAVDVEACFDVALLTNQPDEPDEDED